MSRCQISRWQGAPSRSGQDQVPCPPPWPPGSPTEVCLSLQPLTPSGEPLYATVTLSLLSLGRDKTRGGTEALPSACSGLAAPLVAAWQIPARGLRSALLTFPALAAVSTLAPAMVSVVLAPTQGCLVEDTVERNGPEHDQVCKPWGGSSLPLQETGGEAVSPRGGFNSTCWREQWPGRPLAAL